jgi:hypothetical protein
MGFHHTYFEKTVQFVEPNWVTNSHLLYEKSRDRNQAEQ